jgi:hypothetical protein
MKNDVSDLRILIRETIESLALFEQDRDGDGDEDFDDVRVARMVAGGINKKSAISKVRKKPLGSD